MVAPKTLSLIAILALAPGLDEGQWLPSQLREMNWDELRARGLELTKDELWHPVEGGLLNAAIQIGGCSAALISPRGLAITNHHCADDAIGKVSTLRSNYLKEGFISTSLEAELPTDLEVLVVRKIENVTDEVHAAQQGARNALERHDATQAAIDRLIAEGERNPTTGQADPSTTCHVASFYEGREYHLYYRTKITDVRLVYAPPLRTADYGGNVDNWEWPRHSGDFVLMRAYVAPDGTPRSYAPDNVPYEPDHWMQVSADGVKEGDLVMIMGYPGATERYLSSVAVQEWLGYRYPRRREMFLSVISILESEAARDPQRQLELSATINSFLNIEKHHLGAIEGLTRNATVDRKIREEEAFVEWARKTEREDCKQALDAVLEFDHEERQTMEKDLVLRLFQYRRLRELLPMLESLTALVRHARGAEAGSEIPQDVIDLVASPDATRDMASIQKPLLALLLDEVRNLPEGQMLTGSGVLPDSDVAAPDMIEQLLAQSSMTDAPARLALLRGGRAALAESNDPLVKFCQGLVAEVDNYQVRERQRSGRRLKVGSQWIEAQQAWRGESFYPDANSTLRVSIAEVMGYSPRDAVYHQPFTSVAGMLDKETGADPFKLPAPLKEAARRRWLSRFRDPQLEDVPVCFLANGDTSQGNSGSPVVNGKGHMVGLNFDRVFENVACDFGWNPERSRNISLDMRFVLWHMESVLPAPRLLREIDASR
ncbi:MAG: S46 family peptidase [Planctomycetota bacterium]